MVLFSDMELPYIDPFDPEFLSDPDAVYARAAEESWIAKCPFGGMLLGQQALRDLLRDERLRTPGDHLMSMFGIHDGQGDE